MKLQPWYEYVVVSQYNIVACETFLINEYKKAQARAKELTVMCRGKEGGYQFRVVKVKVIPVTR